MAQIFPGEIFAQTADFDLGIRQLIPKYDEMLDVVVHCLPAGSHRILELGCGTGGLSLKILQRFPDAEIIALDYSSRMLSFAQEKITAAGYGNRWTGIEIDFGEWAINPKKINISTGFDAAVSSLAIHHLSDEMKFNVFQQIGDNLRSHGCFWNADPVLPESPNLAEIYAQGREEWVKQQGINITEVNAKRGISDNQGYSTQDRLATLETHFQMLLNAGFVTVATPWKYYGLAVFGGWVD
ncbi:MAG TPA: class I SAM-dependent methyltransferase [Nostocaceae cyanobacterium]|nr:class I SAM-dependent methyltransferase [Nostocaceae cyanobacterium]